VSLLSRDENFAVVFAVPAGNILSYTQSLFLEFPWGFGSEIYLQPTPSRAPSMSDLFNPDTSLRQGLFHNLGFFTVALVPSPAHHFTSFFWAYHSLPGIEPGSKARERVIPLISRPLASLFSYSHYSD
jgi:hypothetical protein